MTNEIARPQFAAVSEALPAAMVVWKLGSRLIAQAGDNPSARKWARIGAAALGLAGVAVILVGIANSFPAQPTGAQLNNRLEDELEDSFPASDPPAITRSGG